MEHNSNICIHTYIDVAISLSVMSLYKKNIRKMINNFAADAVGGFGFKVYLKYSTSCISAVCLQKGRFHSAPYSDTVSISLSGSSELT